jgi:ring-1,2-phenylacetyl-CoA epoxidase subunit PaaE
MPLSETTADTAKGFFRLRVRDVQRETREAVVVSLDVPAGAEDHFVFVPGQHVVVRKVIDGKEVRRTYSICAAIQDKGLRIAIKRMPDGLFSNWVNDHLAIGDYLEVMPPAGNFGIAPCSQQQRSYVAFAAGSGITPVFSILKSMLLAEPRSIFTLFYSNRKTGTVMFRNELADLKDRFLERLTIVHILTREHQESALLNGRITQEKARQLLEHWFGNRSIDLGFICGPGTFIEEVTKAFQDRCLSDRQIRREFFTSGRSDPTSKRFPRSEPKNSEITLILDGAEHRFSMARDTESILHAGLRQGIDIRYGCQGGVCSSCRGHLRTGEVEMRAHYALEDYEVAQGFVLTCQSYPLTDQVTIDFDRIH